MADNNKKKNEPQKSPDTMSQEELIKLAGGQDRFDEQFFKIFGPAKSK